MAVNDAIARLGKLRDEAARFTPHTTSTEPFRQGDAQLAVVLHDLIELLILLVGSLPEAEPDFVNERGEPVPPPRDAHGRFVHPDDPPETPRGE